jgi:hydroxyacylglutathione hydrolase
MLTIIQLPALTDNYILVVHDTNSGKTAAIDPATTEPVLATLKTHNWSLDYIFNTHHHHDHVGANLQLQQLTGCKVVGAASDQARIPGLDIQLKDGDQFKLGTETLQIISTPGHTFGHIVYYCVDSAALFCGDTLFSLGCGRLFEGTAEQMWQSLQKIKSLPPETRVYCAHEYTQANGRFALTLEADNPALQQRLAEVAELRRQNQPSLPSTLALELATNPFLREHSTSIRKTLGAERDSPAQVFAKIRLLKDQFS